VNKVVFGVGVVTVAFWAVLAVTYAAGWQEPTRWMAALMATFLAIRNATGLFRDLNEDR
jgi:hypothetical protein